MKTYWFTIADGAAYRVHAERLRRSLAAYDVQPPFTTAPPAASRSISWHRAHRPALSRNAGR